MHGGMMAVTAALCALQSCLTVFSEMTGGHAAFEAHPVILENAFPLLKHLSSERSAFPQRVWLVVNGAIFLWPFSFFLRYICRRIFT